MREIKFRAWDKIYNRMAEVGKLGIGYKSLIIGEQFEDCYETFNDQLELMQFTGLKDKNGKEIYEGDIKDYGDYENFKGRCLYEVFWDEEHACFSERSLVFEKGKACGGIDSDGEVIGNRFENPDLIS